MNDKKVGKNDDIDFYKSIYLEEQNQDSILKSKQNKSFRNNQMSSEVDSLNEETIKIFQEHSNLNPT